MSRRRYGRPLRSYVWYWLLIGWWWELYLAVFKLLFRPLRRGAR